MWKSIRKGMLFCGKDTVLEDTVEKYPLTVQ